MPQTGHWYVIGYIYILVFPAGRAKPTNVHNLLRDRRPEGKALSHESRVSHSGQPVGFSVFLT